eukprot:scaffold327780_cov61-Tisochrysis_lutea.AAC.3
MMYFCRRTFYRMRWPRPPPLVRPRAAEVDGGPLALLQSPNSCFPREQGGLAPQIRVFSASGEPLASWSWEYDRCLALGWSSTHQLVSVLQSGRVIIWSMHGEQLADFGLGDECESSGILMAEVSSHSESS